MATSILSQPLHLISVMSSKPEVIPLNRKRIREDEGVAGNEGSACLIGQAPKFSRQKEGSSDVKYGTGMETNEHRIETRLKQIQYGKNTIGYDNYLAAVPKATRSRQQSVHPRTPDPYEESSKRQFDGRVKAWRRELHKWDVMDNIAQVAVPPKRPPAPPPSAGSGSKEVESGEITGAVSNYGSWANRVEPPVCTVVAPVLALSSNNNNNHKAKKAIDHNVQVGTELDSPSQADRGERVLGECIGEDLAALEGVDYDCEAPSDGDEDVL